MEVMSDETDMSRELGIGVWSIIAVLRDEITAGHMNQRVSDGWRFL